MPAYLAYGSNLHPLRLRQRAPSAKEIGVVRLAGWSIRFHKKSFRDGSAKANMIRTELATDMVYCALFTLHPAERKILDAYEGLGNGYERELLDLPGYGPVYTYLAAGTHIDDNLHPYRWYRDLVLAGATFHRFPRHYIAGLAALPAVDDPDMHRRAGNQAILERLSESI
jgi:hypothetical protein